MESSEFVEEYAPEFDTIDCCELKVTQNLLTQAPFEGPLKYPSYDLLNDYKSHYCAHNGETVRRHHLPQLLLLPPPKWGNRNP